MMIFFRKFLLDMARYLEAGFYLLNDSFNYETNNIIDEHKLLIIKLDEIGDYILFRNFLKILRNSKKYMNYSITLLGNKTWKDIFDNFDSNEVDNVIVLDKKLFKKSISYRKQFLNFMKSQSFETVINPCSSRNFLIDDSIVRIVNGKTKIGCVSNYANSPQMLIKISDKYYTRLIKLNEGTHFEFNRNKFFFKSLLEENISIEKPYFDISDRMQAYQSNNNFIVISPGAQDNYRRWSTKNFAAIAEHLIKKYGYMVYVVGNKQEKYLYSNITNEKVNLSIIDYTGNTSLSDLIFLLNNADLLICNDSGTAHIGAAVGVKTIIISNGSRFGRFVPYPEDILPQVISIFPPLIMSKLHDKKYLYKKFRYRSLLNIDSISLEEVEKGIKKLVVKKYSVS